MLPILMFNNMDGHSNSFNDTSSYGSPHSLSDTPTSSSYTNICNDIGILYTVRNRKKVSEVPNCPVCSCTIRQGELESHLSVEIDRLQKLSNGGSKRKLSGNSPISNLVMPGSSTSTDVLDEQEIDVSGCPGSDVYQRIHDNRLRRLRARRRSTPTPQQGECPVCNMTLPMSRLQRHALRCLKRTGAELDEDIPDTSSEDGSIDVENDEPSGGSFGAEYLWGGEARVRASALLPTEARVGTQVRRASNDQALVVDGDEDIELYGPPQYSPSRIAPDGEMESEDRSEQEQENRLEAPNIPQESKDDTEEHISKPNGLVVASAETRIQALKAKIRELENKQNSGTEGKCLICLSAYTTPAVSIQCWHVYCEVCWLQSLRAKKICPQCNAITTTQHLRRIYM